MDTAPPIRRLRLPAALLKVWHEPAMAASFAAAREASRWRPGIAWPRADLCAVTPVAADPAVCDAALAVAQELESRVGDGLRMVILPGTVERNGNELEIRQDPLLTDLDKKAPEAPPGAVLLTSRAAARLEIPRQLDKARAYQGPSGSRAPFYRVGQENVRAAVFRNPEVLRRRLRYVPRPQVDAALARRPAVVRVTGLPGSGKSRATWQTVQGGGLALWVTARPVRHHRPLLAAQILHRLLNLGSGRLAIDGLAELGVDPALLGPEFRDLLYPGGAPGSLADSEEMGRWVPRWLASLATADGTSPTLVVDNLEAASTTDLALLNRLSEAALAGAPLRLIALARSSTLWPDGWSAVPEIVIPALDDKEMAAVARETFAGLELPRPVQERLLEHASGNPFALEEALLALVHGEQIRQVYGSFFFGGEEDAPYLASDRLVQHMESEARRLGASERLRLLAASGMAVPAEILAQASRSDDWVDEDWVKRHLEAGWLRTAATPWGPGIELAVPAFGLALAGTVSEEEARQLRQELGRLLETPSSESTWQRYQLLAGSPEATTALLAAVEEPQVPPRELVAALATELARLRGAGDPQGMEMEILWQLLPRVSQLGKLEEHRDDLERALQLASGDARRVLAFAGLAADLAEQEGRLQDAESIIRKVLKEHPGPENQKAEAVLIIRLGRLLLRQGRHEEARDLLERVGPVVEAAGGVQLAASCHFYLGNAALHQDRLEDALELHLRALQARRLHDRARAVGTSLSALGRVTLRMGRYPEAIAYYQEAEEIFTALGDDGELSFALLGLGKALTRLGSYIAATPPLRQALNLREAQGDAAGVAIARLAVAENHLHLRRLEAALKEARKAHFDLQLLATQAARAEAEQLLGRILLLQRSREKAIAHLEEALRLHRQPESREQEIIDRTWLLGAALASEDEAAIRRRVDQLEAVLEEDCYLEQREVVEHRIYQARAWLARTGDDPERALPHLRQAYRLLLTKVGHLARAQRHPFLHQVPDHRAIVADATGHSLSWPEILVDPADLEPKG